jgi:hypothetical protein
MKLIPLSGGKGKGKFSIVDDADFEWLSRFTFCYTHGYAQTSIGNKRRYLHGLLLPPKLPLHVDHINRDKLDNRRANLRYVTHGDNLRNGPARNSTGIKGVYKRTGGFHPERPWSARVKYKQKFYSLGCFRTVEDAAKAITNFWDNPEAVPPPKPQVNKRTTYKSH